MAKSLALLIVAAGAAAAAAGAVRGQSPDSPASPSASQTASVYLADGKYSIKLGVFDKAAVAYGNYTDMADNPISLFGTLDIETNPAFADTEQVKCSAPARACALRHEGDDAQLSLCADICCWVFGGCCYSRAVSVATGRAAAVLVRVPGCPGEPTQLPFP